TRPADGGNGSVLPRFFNCCSTIPFAVHRAEGTRADSGGTVERNGVSRAPSQRGALVCFASSIWTQDFGIFGRHEVGGYIDRRGERSRSLHLRSVFLREGYPVPS